MTGSRHPTRRCDSCEYWARGDQWPIYPDEARVRRKGGIYAFSADHAIAREAYGPYLERLGWKYTSTKELPRGKGIHLCADELPGGRLIVSLPRHLTAVIDGVIHDTIDCSEEGRRRIRGFWAEPTATP